MQYDAYSALGIMILAHAHCIESHVYKKLLMTVECDLRGCTCMSNMCNSQHVCLLFLVHIAAATMQLKSA